MHPISILECFDAYSTSDVTGRSTKLDAEHYYLYLKWFLDDIPEVTAKLDLCVLGKNIYRSQIKLMSFDRITFVD